MPATTVGIKALKNSLNIKYSMLYDYSCFDYSCFVQEMAKTPTEFEISGAAEAGNATLHGVIAAVSPMKKGSKAEYFDAKITDGEAQLRVVGFRKEQRKRLAEFEDHMQPVELYNCQIKKSRKSAEDLEIVLQTNSRVAKSPRKILIQDIAQLATNPTIRLSELNTRTAYDRVTVMAKVAKRKQPVSVSGGLTKQDIVLADATGIATLTLWETDVDSVTDDLSYKFSNIVVREYQGRKYLSLPKQDASMENIPDIGEVCEDDLDFEEDTLTVHGAEVIGVLNLQTFPACIVCKCKVETTAANLGT